MKKPGEKTIPHQATRVGHRPCLVEESVNDTCSNQATREKKPRHTPRDFLRMKCKHLINTVELRNGYPLANDSIADQGTAEAR